MARHDPSAQLPALGRSRPRCPDADADWWPHRHIRVVLELAAAAPTAPGSLLDWSSLVASFSGEKGGAAKGLVAALRAPSTQEYGQGPTANVACSMQRPEYSTILVVSVAKNEGLQGLLVSGILLLYSRKQRRILVLGLFGIEDLHRNFKGIIFLYFADVI